MIVLLQTSNALRIAWIAVRELLYERVFYLLLCFAGLSIGISLLLGQMTYSEQYKLTLDFMLAGMEISMTIFSIFIGISLFQKELHTGSVSMVLSKPVSRTTFLFGKFIGQSIIQFGVVCAMTLTTLILCSFYQRVPLVPIAQTATLMFYEVTIVTAITYVFAVNAGAITTAVVTFCFFFIGHVRESVSANLNPHSTVNVIWRASRNLFPDLDVFNLKAFASYGLSASSSDMAWATLYAGCCTLFYLFVASVCFSRKDILT